LRQQKKETVQPIGLHGFFVLVSQSLTDGTMSNRRPYCAMTFWPPLMTTPREVSEAEINV